MQTCKTRFMSIAVDAIMLCLTLSGLRTVPRVVIGMHGQEKQGAVAQLSATGEVI